MPNKKQKLQRRNNQKDGVACSASDKNQIEKRELDVGEITNKQNNKQKSNLEKDIDLVPGALDDDPSTSGDSSLPHTSGTMFIMLVSLMVLFWFSFICYVLSRQAEMFANPDYKEESGDTIWM